MPAYWPARVQKRSGTQGHRYWFPNTNVEDNSAALAAMIKAMAPAK